MSFRSLPAVAVLAAFPVTLSAFVDSDELRQEQILFRIDRLKSINGVLVTGRGLARFDGGALSGPWSTNTPKGRDYVGHFQMDVAIQSVPYPNMEMGGSFRIYSELSGFWGSRERIEPREIWLDLLLLKYLGLRMGRIAPRYTPFTLYLPTDHVLMRTAPFFAFYQDRLYDAYLLDQNGRFPMDGLEVRADAELGENRLSFNGHVAKVYGYFEAPGFYDRYHFGTHLRFVEASETVRADAVWTALADLWGTPDVAPAPGPRRNMVFAGRVDADAAHFLSRDGKGALKNLGVEYEGAMSLFTTNANPTNASPAQNGFGHRVTVYVSVKAPDFRARVRAGWQSVDYEFVSPAAQNRALTFGQDGELFAGLGLPPYLPHVGVDRKIALSRSLHAPLSFTYAMNEATPNRAGFFGSADVKVRQVGVAAKVASLSETRAVGSNNPNLRRFLYAEGSASVKVNKWLELGGVGLYETVKREGATNVREDCAATVYGADVTFKPVRKLSLTLSWQSYGLTGRKVRDNYDPGQALRIRDYTPFDYDLEQSLLGATLVYDFSRSFRGTLSYQRRSSADRYDLDMVRTLLVATF